MLSRVVCSTVQNQIRTRFLRANQVNIGSMRGIRNTMELASLKRGEESGKKALENARMVPKGLCEEKGLLGRCNVFISLYLIPTVSTRIYWV